MQREIVEERELLDGEGRIDGEGWARRPLWRYRRSAIKAGKLRIKEWDYYSLISAREDIGLSVTMSDLGYAGLFAVAWFEPGSGYYCQSDETSLLPLGRTGFPEDSERGSVFHEGKKLGIWISAEGGTRRLRVEAPDIVSKDGRRGLSAELLFESPPGQESMNIATSWAENRRAFYYNRKINCMRSSGSIALGGRTWKLDPGECLGGLDWGRGVWTYRNRWFWSSASGYLPEGAFGWNLGYGFSDRSSASENIVFLNGRGHKLEEVEFRYDARNYLADWSIVSSDGRFEASFKPLLDRRSDTKLLLIRSDQHQVFGRFTGRALLDDGSTVAFKDFPGFAEDVYNRW